MAMVCISGTPGTGKTEAARALSRRLGWKLIELNKLAEEKGLYAGYDEKRKCKIVDVGRLSKVAQGLTKENENMILESHYAHDMPCDVVVILRTNPAELRKRLQARGWLKEKIEENVQSEIMEVCKSEALEHGKGVVEIDTAGKAAASVAAEIAGKLGISAAKSNY